MSLRIGFVNAVHVVIYAIYDIRFHFCDLTPYLERISELCDSLLVQNSSILFKLFHGNEILGAHYMIEYFVKDSKSDENHSKILQNQIVSEVDDLRAIFKL